METLLAIDAGTWGLSTAYVADGEINLCRDDKGRTRIPSAISIDASGMVYVGDDAKRRASHHPAASVLTPLLFLGQPPRPDLSQRLSQLGGAQLIATPTGQTALRLGGQLYAGPELAAALLAFAKEAGERACGKPTPRAALVLPVGWDDARRQALLLAARMAEIEILRVLSAPVAAAAAELHPRNPSEKWLVMDLGASQTSASVVEVGARLIEVLGQAHDSRLGALDVDRELTCILAQIFAQQHDIRLDESPSAGLRLTLAAEHAKRSLAANPAVRIQLPQLALVGRELVTFDVMLERETVQIAARGYVDAILALTDAALASSGVVPDKLAGVLLAGGGSRLPLLQHELSSFVRKPLRLPHTPENVFAIGAARYVDALARNPSMAADEVKILGIDLAASAVWVAAAGHASEEVLPANARLPIEAERLFTTAQDDQRQIRVQIEQRHPRLDTSTPLGELCLDGLRPGSRGEASVRVGFSLDENGALNLAITEPDSGQRTAEGVAVSRVMAEQDVALLRETRQRNLGLRGRLQLGLSDANDREET